MTKTNFKKPLIFFVFASTFMFSGLLSSAEQEKKKTDEPLRLEATIRGDKEQPRVISIVPWQLPEHRDIEGTLSWKPKNSKLKPLERKQFLRKVALSKKFSTTRPEKNLPINQAGK